MKKKNYLILQILTLLLIATLQPTISLEDNQNQEPTTEIKKNFNPKPASASLYNLGLRSYDQGDIQSAISYFKRAVDLDPQFVDAYYNLGEIFKLQKKYPDAIVVFEKAVEINSRDYETIRSEEHTSELQSQR